MDTNTFAYALLAAQHRAEQLITSAASHEDGTGALLVVTDELSAFVHYDTEGGITELAACAVQGVNVLAEAVIFDGAMTRRHITPDGRESVTGWKIAGARVHTIDAANVRAAYTTSLDGEPLDPEPGVEYRASYPLHYCAA
ncbi:hypothetical protein ACN20G_28040 (plasmid) [Streptomyces sp. BI20]|uniref:hypothetical protein n=1 Tax=Streptomyces sp. BI20 TaxID=3403460 RepID=UPI003C745ADB